MNKKVALVIGGSGGIGSESVKILATNNFKVCFTYHSNKKQSDALKKLCNENAFGYSMNLHDPTSVKSTVDSVIRDHNTIDVVVFSVTSKVRNQNILAAEWEDYEAHFNIQTKGLFLLAQCLKEQIANRSGIQFIVIGTEYTIGKPPAGLSSYIQAKYSLLGLAKSMAVDLAKYHCTVNVISPGMVDTPLIADLPPKLIEITAAGNPLKKIAAPKDVANVVLFFAKEGASYLNGVNITVNGGNVML